MSDALAGEQGFEVASPAPLRGAGLVQLPRTRCVGIWKNKKVCILRARGSASGSV